MTIRPSNVSTTAALCLLLASGLSACERDKGPAAQGPAPSSATQPLTVRLPSDWPSQVPTYPGSTVVSGMKVKAGDFVVQRTSDPPAKVLDFYKTKLSGMHLVNNVDRTASQSLTWSDDAQPPLRVTLTVGTAAANNATFANLRISHSSSDDATGAASTGQAGAAAQ